MVVTAGIVGNVLLPTRRAAEQTMGMPLLQERSWTADEVRALPDTLGTRYEVVDGELLVSPDPIFRHQQVLGRLYLQLSAFLA